MLRTRPRRSLLAALLAAAGALVSCSRPPASTSVQPGETGSEYSIYDLGSTWKDQAGVDRPLATLAGSPRVIAMIYTHCSATCPITVAEMKRIEALTPPTLGLVLVSLDGDRDTPDRLAQYAAEHRLTPDRWTLLRGSDADVRDLAAVLDIRYRRLSATELAHQNVLTVLDAAGAVVHRQAGLADADDIVRIGRALSVAPIRSAPAAPTPPVALFGEVRSRFEWDRSGGPLKPF
ncbi:MAG: SCO family protein [bacterium]